MPGGFVIGCTSVAGFSADLKNDYPDWSVGLGPHVSSCPECGYWDEITSVSHMVVHPDGTLYFTATDETFRAITPDGGAVWTQALPLVGPAKSLKKPNFGIGDRVFVDGVAYNRNTGEEYGLPRSRGQNVHVELAAYSRRLIGYFRGDTENYEEVVLLDECGNHKLSLPVLPDTRSAGVVAVGFDDSLLVTFWNKSEKAEHYLLSIDGAILVEPRDVAGGDGWARPLALGADGIWYYSLCSPLPDGSGQLAVLALSPTLEVLDRLDFGFLCTNGGATLLDDGTMLIVRQKIGSGSEILRIATSSPGLAHTAWPSSSRDNEHTLWISAW